VLSTTIAEDQKKHKDVEAQLSEIDLQVTELGALFPTAANTSTLDALRLTVGPSANIIHTRSQITVLEKLIFAELSVHAVDDARNILHEKASATLEAKSASIEADIEQAETRLSNASVTRENAERDLGTVTGNA